jgi:hypothetical protein
MSEPDEIEESYRLPSVQLDAALDIKTVIFVECATAQLRGIMNYA